MNMRIAPNVLNAQLNFHFTGEWSFEDYLYYMHFCPNCGAFMREDDNGKE